MRPSTSTAQRAATVLLTALAPASWGTTYVVTTRLLPPGHPLFAGLMRALPAGLLALAITRVLPRGEWWWKTAVLGVLNIGAMPLLFVAAERLPGGATGPRPGGSAGACSVCSVSASSCSDRGPGWTPWACSPVSAIRPPWPAGSSSPSAGAVRRASARSPWPAGS